MKQATVRMNFNITVEFREQIKLQAEKYGMTSSQFCKMAILKELQGGGEIGREKQKEVV